MIIPKPKKIVAINQAVLDEVAHLPRNHLGDISYEVKLGPARLQDPRTGRPPRHGFQSTPVPLPLDLIRDNLNCTLTVKVGKQHLVPQAREEITYRRALWGTDIYTDDSDIVAACIHGGWIRGEWPAGTAVDMLDLYSADDKDKKGKRSAAAAAAAGKLAVSQANSMVVLDAPPKSGPQDVSENQDLHVTVLVLPRLAKYASSCRFGIKSREFGGEVPDATGTTTHRAAHDGLSFMVTGIRWVNNGAGTQNRLRGKARRERIRRALREVELGPVWAARSLNVEAGKAAATGADAVQAAPAIDGDVEMTGGWWKHRGSEHSEGDKENLPAGGGADTVPPAKKKDMPESEKEAVEEAAQGESEDTTSAAKEVDPDETMGDDTIVEDEQQDGVKEQPQQAEKEEAEVPKVDEPVRQEEAPAKVEDPAPAETVEVGKDEAEDMSEPVGQADNAVEPSKADGNQVSEKGDVPAVAMTAEAPEATAEPVNEAATEPALKTVEIPVETTVEGVTTEPATTKSAHDSSEKPVEQVAGEPSKETAAEDAKAGSA
jgi:hypothetical protein